MKLAYKGFSQNLSCRGDKFEIGETYSKPHTPNPLLCSTQGWHYCNKLEDVFRFYPRREGNRFCEIEVLGDFSEDYEKGITTSFRIVRELSSEEIMDIVSDAVMNLKLVRYIQEKFPEFHVGGSIGLFLHGVRLKRWMNSGAGSDIDLVSPYFILPTSSAQDEHRIEYLNVKASANDFDETFIIDDVKVDYRIDPKQRYELVEYRGHVYKVSPLFTILEAKMRYAVGGNKKHIEDFKELTVSVKPKKNPAPKIEIGEGLPF